MIDYQITIFNAIGKYKPIARIVKVENAEDYENNKAKYQQQAIMSICHSMHLTPNEFLKLGYTKVKADSVENIQLKKKIKAIKKAYEKRKRGKENEE